MNDPDKLFPKVVEEVLEFNKAMYVFPTRIAMSSQTRDMLVNESRYWFPHDRLLGMDVLINENIPPRKFIVTDEQPLGRRIQ